MGGINKVILQGRLTREPVLEQKGGFDYCGFTVAWNNKYKEREKTCFLECKSWGAIAKFVTGYFHKGSEAVVEGEIETETWEAKDGTKRSKNICNVERVYFCGSKSSNNASDTASAPVCDNGFIDVPGGAEGTDDELPFNG